MTNFTLYVGDAPNEDIRFTFRGVEEWEAVRSQIENIVAGGNRGVLTIPHKTGAKTCVVVNQSTKLIWIEQP
jgi:hypothetical protein